MMNIPWRTSYSLEEVLVESVEFKTVPNTDAQHCAVEIACCESKLMWVNMYMPIDNQRKTHVDPAFMDIIECIEIFIEKSNTARVGGDMNLDLTLSLWHDFAAAHNSTSCPYNIAKCDKITCWLKGYHGDEYIFSENRSEGKYLLHHL